MGAQGSSENRRNSQTTAATTRRERSNTQPITNVVNNKKGRGSVPPSSLTDAVLQLVETGNDTDPQTMQHDIVERPLQPMTQDVEMVPVVFRYPKVSDEEVYVSGSFNDWQVKVLLEFDEDEGDCSEVLYMPPGTYLYRFIIGAEWAVNDDDDKIIHESIAYNRVEVKRNVFESTIVPYIDSDDEQDMTLSSNNNDSKRQLYGQHIPSPGEYIKDCPKLPPFLSQQILNHDEPVSVDPYVLPTPSHVILNHLYIQREGKINGNMRVVSMTQRFKTKQFAQSSAKFVTTVFYSPKNNA